MINTGQLIELIEFLENDLGLMQLRSLKFLPGRILANDSGILIGNCKLQFVMAPFKRFLALSTYTCTSDKV